MAIPHINILLTLLFLLLVASYPIQPQEDHAQMATSKLARTTLLETIDCDSACGGRCRLSSRPNYCTRACRTCCGRCNCVPSGTSGNYDQCPCYANLTTHGGRKKCP
ncbi:gibberellin-regulated protein 11-like [Typha latifolia]|uniref:gibberellin-regulated protein 11-like n=1 Tax=Typha latifolia TaxID=4733 RepID=UPI003C2CBF21